MGREIQPARLLIEQEIESALLASPFFWRQMASEKARSEWIWGYVTMEFDSEQDGSVAVIPLFRGSTEPVLLSALKGFEVYEGDAIAVGDWNGDGENELIAVDVDGQLHAFGFEGRPLEGIAARPACAKIVHRRPIIVAGGASGRPVLAFLSAGAPVIDAVSALSVYSAPGQSLPGFPLELDPPSVSSLELASMQAGAGRLAFVRENGSICVYDLSLKILRQIAGVKPNLAKQTVIAAADIDSDGQDEIIFASGGDSIYGLRITAEGVVRTTMIQRAGSSFVALAPGINANNRPVLCIYDQGEQQFGFFSGGRVSWSNPVELSPAHRLVSLSRGPAVGGGGSVFVAVFYCSSGDENEESSGKTEMLVLDSNGNAIGGAPIQRDGFCPFLDGDDSMVLMPAMLYEPSETRLLLLAGFCGASGGQLASVCMYEIAGL